MSRTVVFNISHYGFILDAITYRLTKHHGDRCILLITGIWSVPGRKFMSNLKKSGIFDQIIPYDCKRHFKSPNDRVLEKELNSTFSKIQKKIRVGFNESINYTMADIEDSFAMYVLNAKYPLTVLVPDYLLEKNNSFRYTELSRKGLASPPYCEMMQRLGVLDGCQGNCNVIVPSGYSESSKHEVFDYSEAVDKLSDSDLKYFEKLADGYTLPKYGSTIVLTNSINYVKGVGIEKEELPYVYRDLIDYYIPEQDEVYLKPHPFSPNFTRCFPKDRIISPDFNIDLIRYVKNLKIDKTVSVQTTSSDKLSKVCPNQKCVGVSFFINHNLISIVHDLMDKLKVRSSYKIYQDFIVDWIFALELGYIHNVQFDMWYTDSINYNEPAVMMTKNLDYVRNMPSDSACSVIYLNEMSDFEVNGISNSRYVIKRTYYEKYQWKKNVPDIYVFTNDPVIAECFSIDEKIVFAHSKNILDKHSLRLK